MNREPHLKTGYILVYNITISLSVCELLVLNNSLFRNIISKIASLALTLNSV